MYALSPERVFKQVRHSINTFRLFTCIVFAFKLIINHYTTGEVTFHIKNTNRLSFTQPHVFWNLYDFLACLFQYNESKQWPRLSSKIIKAIFPVNDRLQYFSYQAIIWVQNIRYIRVIWMMLACCIFIWIRWPLFTFIVMKRADIHFIFEWTITLTILYNLCIYFSYEYVSST